MVTITTPIPEVGGRKILASVEQCYVWRMMVPGLKTVAILLSYVQFKSKIRPLREITPFLRFYRSIMAYEGTTEAFDVENKDYGMTVGVLFQIMANFLVF